MRLHKVEAIALELLSVAPEPTNSGFKPVFERLIKRGLAQRTRQRYEISEAGCEWLARNVVTSTVPKRDAPCGWVRMERARMTNPLDAQTAIQALIDEVWQTLKTEESARNTDAQRGNWDDDYREFVTKRIGNLEKLHELLVWYQLGIIDRGDWRDPQ